MVPYLVRRHFPYESYHASFSPFIRFPGLRSQTHEMDYRVPSASIVGQIPSDLPSGTLFRNGPALMERGGKTIDQPFDGDGMISRFTLDKGKVHFSNRCVFFIC